MDPAGQADASGPARSNGTGAGGMAGTNGQAQGRRRTESVTRGGVRVTRTEEPFSAPDIDRVCAQVDARRGACSAPAWSTRAGTAGGTWRT